MYRSFFNFYLNLFFKWIKGTDVPIYDTEPLLDDKEKARLAFIFEWSGRLDEVSTNIALFL